VQYRPGALVRFDAKGQPFVEGYCTKLTPTGFCPRYKKSFDPSDQTEWMPQSLIAAGVPSLFEEFQASRNSKRGATDSTIENATKRAKTPSTKTSSLKALMDLSRTAPGKNRSTNIPMETAQKGLTNNSDQFCSLLWIPPPATTSKKDKAAPESRRVALQQRTSANASVKVAQPSLCKNSNQSRPPLYKSTSHVAKSRDYEVIDLTSSQ
jgi:hypothetical protein